jgi:glycine dehydrogenase subunit 1
LLIIIPYIKFALLIKDELIFIAGTDKGLNMAYLSNSDHDFSEMLKTIGVGNFEELISNIPADLRYKGEFNIPEALSEFEVSKLLQEMAAQNKTYTSFLGGGVYDHYIPSIIGAITSRSEFYTSYTPYQPEVSQGNLQAMYEFQSMISELCGMDVTNASMYEAGSALAEAALLAAAQTRRTKILAPANINCRYFEVLKTYTANMPLEIVNLPVRDFRVSRDDLDRLIDEQTAAVIIQHPNYFGFLEDMPYIAAKCAAHQVLLIQIYNPIALGVLKTPGAFGADIAIAEGQPLGNAQNYGGPFLGLFSVKDELVRKIPGRLSGLTQDTEGKRGFVLTLQTREQHIRREKATSNICTNSGLMALTAGIYLATLGKKGLQQVAELCMQKAHYLADQLTKIKDVKLAADAPFFNEFTLQLPLKAESVIRKGLQHGIFAGIGLESKNYPDHLLIAVTEKRTREELDRFVQFMKEAVQ